MWNLHRLLRRAIEGLTGRHTRRFMAEGRNDWLPPALGPQDWYIGLYADRDSAWYFDRDRS
jgi:hypothetical protein